MGIAVCLMFMLAFYAKISAGGEPFISIKASKETIVNYEGVLPIISIKGEKKPYPEHIDVNIVTSSNNYSVEFQLNENVMSGDFVSVIVDENNNKVVDKNEYLNCYYTGKVKENSEWTAFMSNCHGLQMEFGDNKDKENYYHMEPLNKTDPSMDQTHAFYKQSEYSKLEGKFDCDFLEDHELNITDNDGDMHHQRVRRQSSTYYVEFVAVNDHDQYLAFGSNLTATVQRSISIANGMNNLYISNLNIRIVLTMVITFTAGNQFTVSSDSSTLLNSFQVYASSEAGLLNIHRDNMMLFTGINLIAPTIGRAFLGTMCNLLLSLGLSQDGGSLLARVITVATHEVGHNFDMRHTEGRNCSCPEDNCIMESFISSPPATRFSSCSASEINMISNQLTCLLNVPAMTIAGPRCGNGIVEGSEVCDCGEPGVCSNPCCNASTCQLATETQCATGGCCNTSTCQLLPNGMECRASIGECDIVEMCTGSSNECPLDVFMMNGMACASDTGYCFNGQCPTHRAQCLAAWNNTEGPAACFNFNTRGDFAGNCGLNATQYIPCMPSNVSCGQLQCLDGTYQNIYAGSGFFVSFTVGGIRCRSYGVLPAPGAINPGLVEDGTRCGTDMLCIDQECRQVSTLNTSSCPVGTNGLVCSGNASGICNNLGQCSCLPGLAGPTCETVNTPLPNLPTDSTTADLPTDGTTADLTTDGGTTAELPTDGKITDPQTDVITSDLSTTDLPTDDITTNIPTDGNTTDKPTDDVTTDLPTKEITTDQPTDSITTDVPTDGITTDLPTDDPVFEGQSCDWAFI